MFAVVSLFTLSQGLRHARGPLSTRHQQRRHGGLVALLGGDAGAQGLLDHLAIGAGVRGGDLGQGFRRLVQAAGDHLLARQVQGLADIQMALLRAPGGAGQDDGFLDKGLEGLSHNFVTAPLEELVKWARARSVIVLRPVR